MKLSMVIPLFYKKIKDHDVEKHEWANSAECMYTSCNVIVDARAIITSIERLIKCRKWRWKKTRTPTHTERDTRITVDQTNNWVILQNASGVSLCCAVLYIQMALFSHFPCVESTQIWINTLHTHTHRLNGNKPNHNTINMYIFVYYIIFSASKALPYIMLPIFLF